jgi:ribonucleotide monophosphatase NagD (HAD superfamily)
MSFILAVDYDGTLFEGSWPEKGKPILNVVEKVKEFKNNGSEIVLWTCREGSSLEEAIQRCKEELDLEFDAINSNASTASEYIKEKEKIGEIFCTRKIFANFYLDDRSHNIDLFLKIDVKKTCDLHKE